MAQKDTEETAFITPKDETSPHESLDDKAKRTDGSPLAMISVPTSSSSFRSCSTNAFTEFNTISRPTALNSDPAYIHIYSLLDHCIKPLHASLHTGYITIPAIYIAQLPTMSLARCLVQASTRSLSRTVRPSYLTPLTVHFFSSTISRSCSRSYSTSNTRLSTSNGQQSTHHLADNVPLTTDKQRHLQGVIGGEGMHQHDATTVAHTDPLASVIQDLTVPTNGSWVMHNPVYTRTELDAVQVVHRPPTNTSDQVSTKLVKMLRWGFDLVSNYKHVPFPANHKELSVTQLRQMGCLLSPDQWMTRFIFLETTAAIPGMVGGLLRHLQSLRLMRRDGGWIHTLLAEAENERLHLLTFMSMANPPLWFRALILGAQGVFYNLFFITYLISPPVAHRFVACLEEEAVVTYTRIISDIENGYVPEWEKLPAPEIAISYWRLPPDATFLDTLRAIRADEATHRFVNHTFASLDSKKDFNPFAIAEPDATTKGSVYGFTRDEAAAFAQKTRERMSQTN
ncbi:alternative oxidase [Phaffia rhodozyma]|uniref:Alternative oxidase n=1 Tax=Phaffia rhodozyma TaxID=264483 RepID=A0A0F7SNF8_PHARH|nr:alternative oxidase [Phaffia rhodozyma]